MRLYTAVREGKEEIFVSLDGGVNGFFLADAGIDFADMNELIAKWDDAIREKIEKSTMRTVPVATIELRSPIVRPLQDILCLGLNYRDHVEECEDVNLETRQTDAIYFAKRAARIIGDGEGMPLHADICDSLDYESELGVVIGKDAYKVAKEDVDDYIFGYTIVNDISARNLQFRHKQWYFGKSLDGHTAMGPCIVTKDEVGDATNLDVKSYVNGELRQNNNTKNMITPVADIIEELSGGITLIAGTVISTGTPSGVGMGMDPQVWLKEGDEVICEIEKIGQLRNEVIA